MAETAGTALKNIIEQQYAENTTKEFVHAQVDNIQGLGRPHLKYGYRLAVDKAHSVSLEYRRRLRAMEESLTVSIEEMAFNKEDIMLGKSDEGLKGDMEAYIVWRIQLEGCIERLKQDMLPEATGAEGA